ncbi:MAG TPA: TraR/DksA family transcriptional regulator [Sedimentisphaerales bacterium]|nr:TraR/DksA family transcriptional regulator [Sedimentisphaerales bacterium]
MARKGKSNTKQSRIPGKAAAPKPVRRPKVAKKPSVERGAKASAPHNPARTGTHLTAEELVYFRQLLLAKRLELIGDVNSIEDETLQKSRLSASGDLSTMPIHMADIGTANYEQEFALSLLDSERKLLREIHDALQRIADETYGICEGTGKEISKARLKASPWARYCIEYARMVEQGLVKEGQEYIEDDDDIDVLGDEDVPGDDTVDEEGDETPDLPEEEPLPEDEDDPEDDMDWRKSKN